VTCIYLIENSRCYSDFPSANFQSMTARDQSQLVQPAADGVLVHLHREAARHLGFQVHAAPADHAVDLRIGTCQHQVERFGPLQVVQGRLAAGSTARRQAGNPGRSRNADMPTVVRASRVDI
jgi:hypothetical protein